MGIFAFDYRDRNIKRVRVLFCVDSIPESSRIETVLQRQGERLPPPDRIVFMYPDSMGFSKAITDVLNNESFLLRLKEFTRFSFTPEVVRYAYGGSGEILDTDGNEIDSGEQQLLRDEGLKSIFRSRNGLLVANTGFHYTKPSGEHSQYFVRVGNLIACNAEVGYIAFCCLRYIQSPITNIYCDTGAIFPIAYAISQQRALLSSSAHPTITSFGSYRGLTDFEFEMPKSSLILVSASTSGRLALKLREHDSLLQDRHILTLYFLGDSSNANHAICDLTQPNSFGESFQRFSSYANSAKCALCRIGWSTLTITDEHFIPGASHVGSVLIRSKDSPGHWLAAFIKKTQGTGIVRAHYKDEYSKYEIFLDVARMFGETAGDYAEVLKSKFEWIVDQNVPYATSRIIHLDDDASKSMANAISSRIVAAGMKPPETLPLRDVVVEVNDDHVTRKGATVVVASAVSSGRRLLGVSQQLRKIQRNDAFQYIIGILRCPTVKIREELRSNLTFGPRPHGFSFLEEVYLPQASFRRSDPWDEETDFLQEFQQDFGDFSNISLELVENRLEILRDSQAVESKGLEDNLFLSLNDESSMTLRAGFAFLDYDYTGVGAISQAQTYMVISAVLHHLRQASGGLRQDSFKRTVLSPRCFDRFNDGVIQSSFLRAATPAEIDYSTDAKLSSEMFEVLKVVFANSRNDIGEASREFALSLSMSRLRLTQSDTASIVDFALNQQSMDLLIVSLFQYWQGRLSNE